ncbi:MAG: type VI secretion system tube protein Hcp [Hyphomicrobiales bacterium]|nr:type VI secretion system tube protein Hcp [Hyphomicrobiales bacterium]
MSLYMKFGDIKGNATQEGFKEWINIASFTWQPAVDRKIKTETGKARNREEAQPHLSNIQVQKEVDYASGPLYKSLVAVPEAKECKIAFVRTGPGGDSDKYLEYTLTDTLLAGLEISGSGDRALETWHLDFTELEIEVKQLQETNEAKGPYRFKYNLAKGKQG